MRDPWRILAGDGPMSSRMGSSQILDESVTTRAHGPSYPVVI